MDKSIIDFINYHKLDLNDFFDAQGRTSYSCRDEMKALDKLFAFNTNDCPRCGPTVRDRHGHCLKCNTASIAFNLRSKQTGHIYIACSKIKEMTKVGMSTEMVEKRISKLNSRRVGNTNDWISVYSIKCDHANEIEFLIHSELKKYKTKGEIYGDTESREVFRCSFQKAIDALNKVISFKEVSLIENKWYVRNTDEFNFRNLINPENI